MIYHIKLQILQLTVINIQLSISTDKGDRFNWAIIQDFKCDIVGDTPQVVFENPENTIKGNVCFHFPSCVPCTCYLLWFSDGNHCSDMVLDKRNKMCL